MIVPSLTPHQLVSYFPFLFSPFYQFHVSLCCPLSSPSLQFCWTILMVWVVYQDHVLTQYPASYSLTRTFIVLCLLFKLHLFSMFIEVCYVLIVGMHQIICQFVFYDVLFVRFCTTHQILFFPFIFLTHAIFLLCLFRNHDYWIRPFCTALFIVYVLPGQLTHVLFFIIDICQVSFRCLEFSWVI